MRATSGRYGLIAGNTPLIPLTNARCCPSPSRIRGHSSTITAWWRPRPPRDGRAAGVAERMGVADYRREVVRFALDIVSARSRTPGIRSRRRTRAAARTAKRRRRASATTPPRRTRRASPGPTVARPRREHHDREHEPDDGEHEQWRRDGVDNGAHRAGSSHGARQPRVYDGAHGGLRAHDAHQRRPRPHRADAAGAVRLVLRHVRRRLAVRDAEIGGIAHFAEHMFFKGTERRPPRATSRPRSTASAASSTPSPARSTRATTSSAPRRPATSRSTCSSTCSATRVSTPRRSTARRASSSRR